MVFYAQHGSKDPLGRPGNMQAESGVVGQAVIAAVKAGYRHIDCARFYKNEKEIGLALKKLFEDGVVKREELFITSKLWCGDQAPEDVAVAIDSTLQDLQLDTVDLYLIHWPFRLRKGTNLSPENFVQPDILSTWAAMEKVYDSSKARAIGAYSPLGSPGTKWINSNVLTHPVLKEVAENLGKTPAQVALRWGLQMGHSVLPKSTNETRIKENIELFDWSIPDGLFAKFSYIEQIRLVRGEFFINSKSIYKSIEELWDGEI